VTIDLFLKAVVAGGVVSDAVLPAPLGQQRWGTDHALVALEERQEGVPVGVGGHRMRDLAGGRRICSTIG
jgi:hypothetical protein